MRDRVAQWFGLLSVEITIDDANHPLQGVLVEHVADVVEEGIGNAFRHGGAKVVHVDVFAGPSSVTVAVVDDGSGPRHGPPGFGSALMNQFGADWSLTAASGGTRLEVMIPTSLGDE